jgi:hypothetical protein
MIIFFAEGGYVHVELQNNSERVDRFIEAFEKLYGRKPKVEDADGDFKIQVARDMQMSVGGARYYIRLASLSAKQKRNEFYYPLDCITMSAPRPE